MRLPPEPSGEDVSPAAGWRHSVMAHAWNDPYFQATVEDQVARLPDYAGDIEDKCLSCHSPMAHTHAHSSGLGLSSNNCAAASGCYTIEQASRDQHAREGVSCTLCHQMTEPADGAAPGSGNYHVAAVDEPGAMTIYGPFPNPLARPMHMHTDYQVAQGAFLSESRHCASCHELRTPAFDVNTGLPLEPPVMFREQAPYAEWLNSDYAREGESARSCQACHMPQPGGYSTQIAVRLSGYANSRWPVRTPYSQHDLYGGNAYLLDLLADWRETLGIATSTTEAGFRDAARDTRTFLRSAAELRFSCASRDGAELSLCVDVINHSGHKLPTGYPSRRMWLQLTVTDSKGRIVFESGAPDEHGRLPLDDRHLAADCLHSGSGDTTAPAACYEPHRQDISQSEQVAIYESVMANSNGEVNYSLLHGVAYLKDNRLPPRGFSTENSTFDIETAVTGAASSDPDFNRAGGEEGSGRDTVHYSIALPEMLSEPLQVQAQLWYQSIRPGFIQSLEQGGDRVKQLKQMTRRRPPAPELLARANSQVD